MFADYYAPSPESISKYPIRELFYNACKQDYTVKNCMVYFSNSLSDLTTAIVTKRNDVLEHLRQSGFFMHFFRGNFTTQYIQMLCHRDMTLSSWCCMLMDYSTKERVTELFHSGDTLSKVFRMCRSPILSRLWDHFGIIMPPAVGTIQLTPETIILKYKLGMSLRINPFTQRVLSSYDSVKFPSYDLFDDICSGNYHAVAHKLHTCKQDVPVEPVMPLMFIKDAKYIDYLGVLREEYPHATKGYHMERLDTIGQCKKHLTPQDAERYLQERQLVFV